jgi:hypothetical protein
MGKKIDQLDLYGSYDSDKIKADIIEVSKNSGTSLSPIYAPDGSRQMRLDDLATKLKLINPYTASNGLSMVGDDIQLGGTLTENTTLDLSSYDFVLKDGNVKILKSADVDVGISLYNNTSVFKGGLIFDKVRAVTSFYGPNPAGYLNIDGSRRGGIITSSPSAILHISGATGAAGFGALKIDSAPLVSITEIGLFENDGIRPYYTNDLSVRNSIAFTSDLGGASSTEIGYLSGATSNIQNQINNIISGLSWKVAVRVATTANITLSGTQTIDGVSVVAGDRVLVKNQTTAYQNGIYVCAAGTWTRATDATTGGSGSTGLLGATCLVEEGTANADKIFLCSTDAPITVGTTSITFIQTSSSSYTASNGIALSGNNFTFDNTYFSGDVTISSLGVLSIGSGKVTNAMLAGSIADGKLASSYLYADGTRGLTGAWYNTQNASFAMLGVGTGSTAPSTTLHTVETGTSTPRGLLHDQYNNGTNSSQTNYRKARGTFASPSTIVSGDVLSNKNTWGHDGTQFIQSASIRITSAGTIGTNRIPSKMEFMTSTDASPSVITTALTLDQNQKATFSGAVQVSTLNSAGFVQTDSSGNFSTAALTSSQVLTALGFTPASMDANFGDGSDGDATITTTVTLTSDKYYHNLTISGAGQLITNAWKVYVSGTLDISAASNGAIRANGANGNAGSTAGTGGAASGASTANTIGTNQTSVVGGVGGTTTGTQAGTVSNQAAGAGGVGGQGSAGGNGSSGSGGAARVGGAFGNTSNIRTMAQYLLRGATLVSGGAAGGGGGGGGGDGTSGAGGGSGGSGGCIVFLYAKTINRSGSTAAGAISAIGGNGGNGGSATGGNRGGGGGGGGAGGGFIYVVYETLTGSSATNCFDASGGTGGNGGNGFGTGTAANGGDGGNGGRIVAINALTGVVTAIDNTGISGTGGGSPIGLTGGTGGAGTSTKQNL